MTIFSRLICAIFGHHLYIRPPYHRCLRCGKKWE